MIRTTKSATPRSTDRSTPIRFGLIGCGRISTQHLGSITQFQHDLQLVAACDVRTERARAAVRRYGGSPYTDYRKLLARPDIDVVAICTPNSLHAPMAIAAARAGKHAVVEKPLTITLTDTDRVIRAFQRHQRKLFAVKQVRYNPAILVTKDALDRELLGKILTASVVIRWTRPQTYYDLDPWRGTKRYDGGSLLNQGIHYVDVLQWFLGPVRSVFAKTATKAHRIETEDVANALLVFRSGAFVNLEFTLCTYPKNLECSITLLGERGTVKIGGTAVNELEVWDVANTPKPVVDRGLPPNVYAGGLYQGSCPNHVFVYGELIEVLRNRRTTYTDGAEARKSMEIVHAVYQSARTKREVRLPLPPR